jgi:hypothetical protein
MQFSYHRPARQPRNARYERYQWQQSGRSRAPGHEGGAMKLVITGAVVIFVIFYIMTSPNQAAGIVHNSWHAAVNVAHGLGGFVNKLAS